MALSLDKREHLKQFLLKHTRFNVSTGCWLYTRCHSSGYGQVRIEDKEYKVHRISLFLYKKFNLNGKLHALHVRECFNKNCWNPTHLYAGDDSDNTMDRVYTGKHSQKRKTHCLKNHEYTPENTYITTRNQRVCKICNRLAQRKN